MGDDHLQNKSEDKHSQQQFVAEKSVKENGTGGEIAAVESVEELKDDQHMLQAKYESSLSLEELEHYATEELGMQTLKPSQIFYIDLG